MPEIVKPDLRESCPKLSGTFVGRTKLTGQGRPALRLAAWRAVWGAVITTGQAWDPHIATHGANGRRQLALAA